MVGNAEVTSLSVAITPYKRRNVIERGKDILLHLPDNRKGHDMVHIQNWNAGAKTRPLPFYLHRRDFIGDKRRVYRDPGRGYPEGRRGGYAQENPNHLIKRLSPQRAQRRRGGRLETSVKCVSITKARRCRRINCSRSDCTGRL
ncbi:hypothetical protein EVAR_10091_1 [Eumeta japonica]|uniref:Uncharacterized protein n=1 Tax=Eumeta variegata TaxID=151549 RepID=A0A4C1UCY2_EUMVA|nr:hypothetical protein EVAR_10091_1 [Eumeta japonica]